MLVWDELKGNKVAGYTLGNLLRTANSGGWFATKDEQQKPWVIFVSEAADQDALLSSLETASNVKHPNVVAIQATGRAHIHDQPVVYAVLEATEQDLGSVLRTRALTPDETAQIGESLVAGLKAIHDRSLFHGQVNSENVWASGDTVKLTSDCLKQVPADARADSFGQDTGDLGATLFEALTQRKLTSPDDPAIGRLPAPFGPIVRNAVNGQWGLPEIGDALKKPVAKTAAVPVIAAKPAPPAKPAMAPAVPAPAAAARTAAAYESKAGSIRILAIVAVLLVIGIVWFFHHGSSSAPSGSDATSPAQNASAPASAAAEKPAAGAVAAPAPVAPRPSPRQEKTSAAVRTRPSAASPAVAPSESGRIWRVVIYAFGSEEAAQRKATSLIDEHPELKPEVFTAKGTGPWLLTVGGPMDHDQAIELRDKVRDMGLPQDSYAQNYSH